MCHFIISHFTSSLLLKILPPEHAVFVLAFDSIFYDRGLLPHLLGNHSSLLLSTLPFSLATFIMSSGSESVDEHAKEDVVNLVGLSSEERPTLADTLFPSDSTSPHEGAESEGGRGNQPRRKGKVERGE